MRVYYRNCICTIQDVRSSHATIMFRYTNSEAGTGFSSIIWWLKCKERWYYESRYPSYGSAMTPVCRNTSSTKTHISKFCLQKKVKKVRRRTQVYVLRTSIFFYLTLRAADARPPYLVRCVLLVLLKISWWRVKVYDWHAHAQFKLLLWASRGERWEQKSFILFRTNAKNMAWNIF